MHTQMNFYLIPNKFVLISLIVLIMIIAFFVTHFNNYMTLWANAFVILTSKKF